MASVLSVIALLVGIMGSLFLSEATAGVGMIAFACLLAICARMAQAEKHHKAEMLRATVATVR